jgi:hypothetical protein
MLPRRTKYTARYCVTLLGSVFLLAFCQNAFGQVIVDKIVARVSDGIRTELITLSDLRWQLAMQPGVPIDPPARADLERALELQIDQRIFALEAERLPRDPPSEKEIASEIETILGYFPSTNEFVRRLSAVGFGSIRDENFERIIAQRLAIERYLDFRFRSFVVITPDEEKLYYDTIFVPQFRERFPGVNVPSLEQRREEIIAELTEEAVAASLENFLEQARLRLDVTILGLP